MSDSSIDDELFGQDTRDNKTQTPIKQDNIPAYTQSFPFQQMVRENHLQIHSRYGYICIFLYKDYYFPGQTVRGFALIDLFNPIQSNKIMIRVKGKEIPGKHGLKISKKLKEDPESFSNGQYLLSQQSVLMGNDFMKHEEQITLNNQYSFKQKPKHAYLNLPTVSSSINLKFQTLRINLHQDQKKSTIRGNNQRVGFEFKDQVTPNGQYRLPFSFKMPATLPGSFKYQSRHGDKILIQYSIDIYFDKFKGVVRHKKELEIREFLFTSQEIDEDYKNFEKIRNIKHVLKPVASVAQMVSLGEKHFIEDSQQLRLELKSQVPYGLTNNNWSLDQVNHQFDLKLLQLFKDGVLKKKKQEKQEFIFDLEKILSDFKDLERFADDKIKKSQIIQQMSFNNKKEETVKPQGKRRESFSIFERQLSRFIEETSKFTFYSVYGLTIQSEFTLDVTIVVADKFSETAHEKKFPIIIRQPKNGDYLIDYGVLEAPKQAQIGQKILERYNEFVDPFSLTGCNFEIQL
ncbi:UNKNOWN [Stylonychia lemnae]|uniref:Arrestin-like N-terminal domain-containing protein n=1 Tax=Stylonychia lemnae TaxID=5949 RepID=A0A078AZ65_STYLE|nr:UNKNOWN [Stylonychia lemnae]|eukprot:CDW87434.1 UNKNOWN [Stylonychia lemnae]